MKYLKKYSIFLEDKFEIEDTDSPDVKMSKEKMNTIKDQMTTYKTKKLLIDKLYSTEGVDIEKGLEDILGPTDIQNGPDRNPFLVEYAHIAKLDSDVNKLHKDNVNDKIKLDDFQEELGLSKDNSTKDSVSSKINDIKNRMSERSSKIDEIKKDLLDSEKAHKEKMIKLEVDMNDYIQNISTSDEK